ncbi:hypothetical protein JCM16408A_21570 [Methylobacterium phyllosphaerae]
MDGTGGPAAIYVAVKVSLTIAAQSGDGRSNSGNSLDTVGENGWLRATWSRRSWRRPGWSAS